LGLGVCEHADLREDVAVGRGGCVVRSARGSIDATIETQLERIAATLLPARTASAAPESGT